MSDASLTKLSPSASLVNKRELTRAQDWAEDRFDSRGNYPQFLFAALAASHRASRLPARKLRGTYLHRQDRWLLEVTLARITTYPAWHLPCRLPAERRQIAGYYFADFVISYLSPSFARLLHPSLQPSRPARRVRRAV